LFLKRVFLIETCVRWGADKFLARPRRKQTTATKLGIYSNFSTRSL